MFLKWAGGKRRLLQHILPLIPKNVRVYYEPFMGGGAVLFAMTEKNPEFIVANDSNEELILCYETVRDKLPEVLECLSEMKSKDSEDFYYEVRGWDRNEFEGKTKPERAARFIYLNKTGYNGLWRVNQAGFNNVPFGHREFRYDENLIREAAQKLSHVLLKTGDFAVAVDSAGKNDFAYFDPPYMETFTGYTKNGFGEEEQKRLRDVCVNLMSKGTKILVSNKDLPAIRDIWNGFKIEKIDVFHALGCKDRKNVGEVLIKNF